MRLRQRYSWLLAVAALALLPNLGCGTGNAPATAEALIEDDRPREAVRVLTPFVRKNPRDVSGRVLMGRALTLTKQFVTATQHLDAALELAPHDADAIEYRARAYREEILDKLERSEIEAAREVIAGGIADLQARLPGHPEQALVYQWLGNLHLLKFESHKTEILDLLAGSVEDSDLPTGPLLAFLYRFILADERTNTQSRAQFLRFIRQSNPAFGGIAAVEQQLMPAREAFLATLTALEQALREDPTLTSTALALASIHTQVNQTDEAIDVCRQLLEIPATGEKAERIESDKLQARLLLAQLQARDGDRAAALVTLEAALATPDLTDSKRLEILNRMCFLQAELGLTNPGYYAQLNSTVRSMLSIEPNSIVAKVHQAIVAYELDRDWRRTIVILRSLPPLPPARYGHVTETLANAHRQLGEYDVAILKLTKLLDEDPKRITARALLADTFRLKGYADDAIAECLTILREDHGNAAAQEILRKVRIGEIYGGTLTVESIAEAQDILRRDQFNDDVRYQHAMLLAEAGTLPAARREMEVLAERFPSNYYPHIMLGRFHLLEGDTREAHAAFIEAQKLERRLPDALVGQARCLLRERSYKEADKRLSQALRLSPEDPETLLLMATLEARRGNPRIARRYIDGDARKRIASLRELAPESMATDLACCIAEIETLEAAEKDPRERSDELDRIQDQIEQIIQSAPRLSRPRVALVRCLEAAGIEHDPRTLLYPWLKPDGLLPKARNIHDEDAVVLLFSDILSKRDIDAALEVLERFSRGPSSLRARLQSRLGLAQFEAGNLDAATALANAALRTTPLDPGANRLMAKIQLQRGNPGALKSLNRVVSAVPSDVEAYRMQAEVLAARGSAQVFKVYQRLLKLVPEDLDVVQKAADLFERKNRGGAMSPKLIDYARSTLFSKSAVTFARKLVTIRYHGGMKGPEAAAAMRFRALALYCAERLERTLGPLLRLTPYPAARQGRNVASKSGDTDVPLTLDRDERRVLAAFLLSQGAPSEAFWTITRFDAGEGRDEDFDVIDREIILTALAELGRLDEARDVLDDTVRTWPSDPNVADAFFPIAVLTRDYEAARQWIELHVPSEGRQNYRHFLRLIEDRPVVEPLPGILLLRIHLFRQFPLLWSDAVREARNLAEILPSSPVPYLIWAETLQQRGDLELAVRVLQQSIERTPTDVPTILALAQVLIARRDEKLLAEAGRILESGLDARPDSVELIVARANLQLRVDRLAKRRSPVVLKMFQAALEKLEQSGRGRSELAAEVYARLGRAYLDNKRIKQAEENFAKAIDIDPEPLDTRSRHITTLLRLERIDDAVAAADRLVEDFPESANAWLLLARSLMTSGAPTEALSALRMSLEQDPLRGEAYVLSGEILDAADQPAKSIRMYRLATFLHPGLYQSWSRIASGNLAVLEAARQHDSLNKRAEAELQRNALEAWNQTIAFSPRGSEEWGNAVRGILRLLEAREDWEEVLEMAGPFQAFMHNDPTAALILGRAYIGLGRGHEADQQLSRAVRLAPQNPSAHFYLAEAYQLRGATKDARLQLTQALKIAGDQPFPERDEAERRLDTSSRRKKRDRDN